MLLEKGPTVEVPKIVSDAQIQFYIDNGYLTVPDVIEEHEIEVMRQDVRLKSRRCGKGVTCVAHAWPRLRLASSRTRV